MASGKLSPRQKMINMMYLVLTALLAMNVSKEVINAFKNVNESIGNSMRILSSKNTTTYESLKIAIEDPQTKVKAEIWKPVADEIAKASSDLINDIESYKLEIKKASKLEKDENGDETYKFDNLDAGTRIMIKGKKGIQIYDKVNAYKKKVIEILNSANITDPDARAKHLLAVKEFEKSLPLDLRIPKKNSYGKPYPAGGEGWAQSSFYMTPSIAGVTVLTKIQSDIKSSEGQLSEYCLTQIGKVKLVFDKFATVASANTTYCMPGEEIEVSLGVGAFNDQAKPTFTVNGSPVALGSDGKAIYKTKAQGEGEKTLNCGFSFYTPDGKQMTENKTIRYTVGRPSGAALMLDKMNVFYIGLDNPVTVSSGTGDEKTTLSASGGGVSLNRTAPGKYIVRATTVGESTITVSDGKQNTPFKFRVKRVPDPLTTIGGTIKSGKLPKGTLQVQQGVKAILENFDFDAKFTVNSFDFTYVPKNGVLREGKCQGDRFSQDWISAVNGCKPNDVFLIENVKVTGPDGSQRKISGMSVQIRM
ncbi:MAG: gliding motility protein GldM [Chitinophagales bacterium]